jgi:ribosomal protein S18 acetylase RimI-like enzyme
VEIQSLTIEDVGIVASVDRSERVDREYEVIDGELQERRITMADIPAWEMSGSGAHSVAAKIEFCRERIRLGGELVAAAQGAEVLGVMVVEPRFDPPLARLTFLHVSRPHRRQGVASALWRAAVERAVEASATALYVSAVPTGSAVGFYLRQGCRLADPPHDLLLEEEPEDVHLVCRL